MSDIVERWLRALGEALHGYDAEACYDADEIERLRQVESLLIDQVTEAQMEAAHLREQLAAANAVSSNPDTACTEWCECPCHHALQRIGGAG